MPDPTFEIHSVFKKDLFGRVEMGYLRCGTQAEPAIRRHHGRAAFWLRWAAFLLARREALALTRLARVEGVPHLICRSRGAVIRSFIAGKPLQEARPRDPLFYAEALRLLRRIHGAGITHNDTHKEPNWLVTEAGEPVLVDFQLASRFRRRSRWFRLLALEDVRHLLKHKRKYCPGALTSRQKAILSRSSWPARWWRRGIKPGYRFITRRLLSWRDDEGHGGKTS